MKIGRKSSGMIRQLFLEIDPMACQKSGEKLCTSCCYQHGLHALKIIREALGFQSVAIEEVYRFLAESLSEDAVQRVWGAIAEEELVVSGVDRVLLYRLLNEAGGTICHKVHEATCNCHQRSYDAVQAIAGLLGCIEMTSQKIAESIRRALLPYSLQAFAGVHFKVRIEMLPRLAYIVGPDNIRGKILPRLIFLYS